MQALHVFLLLSLLAVCTCAPQFLEFMKFRSSERRDVDSACPPDMGGKHCRCFKRGRSFQMRCKGFGEDGPVLKTKATEDLQRLSNATSSPFSDGTFFNPIRGLMHSLFPAFLSPFGPPPQARHPPPPHFFNFPSALGIIITHHDDVKPGESKSAASNTTTTTTTAAPKAKTDEAKKKL